MSVFNGAIRPPAVLSDEAVERYLAVVRAELEIDPLFRRRLRGQVMNQYVAARESGVPVPKSTGRSMGKVGRAALFTSVALATTTTSVLAASQEAVPGDLLYPLKREVEELRVAVLPAHLQDDLAAYELTERIQELSTLAERGDDARVAALAVIVEREYEAFVAANDAVTASADQQLLVIAGMIEDLPQPAQELIEQARHDVSDSYPWQASALPGATSGAGAPEPGANGQAGIVPGDGTTTGGNDGSGNATAGGDGAGAEPTPQPATTPKPTPTFEPEPIPDPTPAPTAVPAPDPTPRGQRQDAQGENDQ